MVKLDKLENTLQSASNNPLNLLQALKDGHNDIAVTLIKDGVGTEDRDNFGNTPLHLAAEKGLLNIAALLLENGANINATNNNLESTPLRIAILKNKLDVVNLLLNHGADIQVIIKELINNNGSLFVMSPNQVHGLIAVPTDIKTKIRAAGLTDSLLSNRLSPQATIPSIASINIERFKKGLLENGISNELLDQIQNSKFIANNAKKEIINFINKVKETNNQIIYNAIEGDLVHLLTVRYGFKHFLPFSEINDPEKVKSYSEIEKKEFEDIYKSNPIYTPEGFFDALTNDESKEKVSEAIGLMLEDMDIAYQIFDNLFKLKHSTLVKNSLTNAYNTFKDPAVINDFLLRDRRAVKEELNDLKQENTQMKAELDKVKQLLGAIIEKMGIEQTDKSVPSTLTPSNKQSVDTPDEAQKSWSSTITSNNKRPVKASNELSVNKKSKPDCNITSR
jgi:hypothetical protein